MDQNTKDMLDALDFIRERMATKDDLAILATKDDIISIAGELASLRRDIEEIAEKVDNIAGLPKEIDHALERIAAIERHLGINKRIAA
jgi:uncharacterized membrane protein